MLHVQQERSFSGSITCSTFSVLELTMTPCFTSTCLAPLSSGAPLTSSRRISSFAAPSESSLPSTSRRAAETWNQFTNYYGDWRSLLEEATNRDNFGTNLVQCPILDGGDDPVGLFGEVAIRTERVGGARTDVGRGRHGSRTAVTMIFGRCQRSSVYEGYIAITAKCRHEGYGRGLESWLGWGARLACAARGQGQSRDRDGVRPPRWSGMGNLHGNNQLAASAAAAFLDRVDISKHYWHLARTWTFCYIFFICLHCDTFGKCKLEL